MRWELGLMEYEWGDFNIPPTLEVFDGDRWVASLAVTACETCDGAGRVYANLRDKPPFLGCPARCFDGYTIVDEGFSDVMRNRFVPSNGGDDE